MLSHLSLKNDMPIRDQQIRRIHQLDTTYRPFHSEQRIDLQSKQRAAGEWFKKDCIGSVTTWEDLVEKFVQKFYQLTDHNEEIEAEEDDDPDDITDIFKIEGNLFDYETPLCKAFNDFNYLLKINTDLFTFDIQGIGTYKEYELNNHVTRDLEEPCSDIDGFCNGGELHGMDRVGSMTYFQDHKWYDELVNGRLKEETLMHKAKVKESWGNATPVRTISPFGRNYDTSNTGNTQDNKGNEELMDDLALEPSVCKIRRFEMIKYSFNN
ncbi:hypothetical protein Tco_0732896 [Tanacetum coccineum]